MQTWLTPRNVSDLAPASGTGIHVWITVSAGATNSKAMIPALSLDTALAVDTTRGAMDLASHVCTVTWTSNAMIAATSMDTALAVDTTSTA